MKRILIALTLISFQSEAIPVLTPKALHGLVQGVCHSHADAKDECMKMLYKTMKYVQLNHGFFEQCQKVKELGGSQDDDSCKRSGELVEYIEEQSKK